MGSARTTEKPAHEVTLSPFLLAKYEVAQREWRKILRDNPSRFVGDDLPVESTTWGECQEFCRRTGLNLPTEAQWEYACRAGTTSSFPFGESITTARVNFLESRTRPATVAVVSGEPNAFGFHHMHGNVEEWCEDVYDPDFYHSPRAIVRDPVCVVPGNSEFIRSVRGGSCCSPASSCRSASRFGRYGRAVERAREIGFRSDPTGFRPAFYPLPPGL